MVRWKWEQTRRTAGLFTTLANEVSPRETMELIELKESHFQEKTVDGVSYAERVRPDAFDFSTAAFFKESFMRKSYLSAAAAAVTSLAFAVPASQGVVAEPTLQDSAPPASSVAAEKEKAFCIYEYLKEQTRDEAPNTSLMVNWIGLLARADAENVREEVVLEAVRWLNLNRANLFDSNESMEVAMYYGAYLDKAYPDNQPLSRIGWQTFKAVKYVYRNLEKPDDESPQRALKKMEYELDRYLLTHP